MPPPPPRRRRQQQAAAAGGACGRDFARLWPAFVAALVDTAAARGPALPRGAPAFYAAPPPLALPPAARLVAVGDLHGDLAAAKAAFRVAGLVGGAGDDAWAGGAAVAVQVGDLLDRGGDEVALLHWLARLARQAAAAGGALHVLLGNHETMNVAAQFRYATPEGLADFKRLARLGAAEAALLARCGCRAEGGAGGGGPAAALAALRLRRAEGREARAAALAPGGAVSARFLARLPTVLQVGSTLFAHGGVLPQHVAYGLGRINAEASAWVSGADPAAPKPAFLSGRNAVVWARDFSHEDPGRCDCAALARSLAGVPGAARLVMGHTIQEAAGVNAACGGAALRVDVGVAAGCGGGAPQALEILRDGEVVRVLGERPAAAAEAAAPAAAVAAPVPVPVAA